MVGELVDEIGKEDSAESQEASRATMRALCNILTHWKTDNQGTT